MQIALERNTRAVMLEVSSFGNVQNRNRLAPASQWDAFMSRACCDHRTLLRVSQPCSAPNRTPRARFDRASSILCVLLILSDARRVPNRAALLGDLRDERGARRRLRAHHDSRYRYRAVGAGSRFFSRRGLFLL